MRHGLPPAQNLAEIRANRAAGIIAPNTGTLTPDCSDLQEYLSNSQQYHFLRYNEAERAAPSDLQTWYDDIQDNSNFEALELAQESLFAGDYDDARAYFDGISAENYIEENSIAFYNLYANYEQSANDETYTFADSSALVDIAQLCPIEYGPTVYKARALYNTMYGTVVNYEDCSATSEERHQASGIKSPKAGNLNADLYPNPASSRLIIKSIGTKDDMFIHIFDITGREVLSKQLKTENFTGVVDLDLPNGAYLVKINNAQNQVLTKKLLIAK